MPAPLIEVVSLALGHHVAAEWLPRLDMPIGCPAESSACSPLAAAPSSNSIALRP